MTYSFPLWKHLMNTNYLDRFFSTNKRIRTKALVFLLVAMQLATILGQFCCFYDSFLFEQLCGCQLLDFDFR